MFHSKMWIFWFGGAILFFIAAVMQPDRTLIYVPLGIVFLILSGGPLTKKKTT